jgi:hypothetical protein
MMPRQPISWIKPHDYKNTYGEGDNVLNPIFGARIGEAAYGIDAVGTRYLGGIGFVYMRHNVLNGYSGFGFNEAGVNSNGFNSADNFPIGRFACFVVFKRTVADSAPSNYSDFYMAHGNSPTDPGASGGGNYIWGRGSGLSQVSTAGGGLAKTFYQCDVSPTATTVGTAFTISGGSRPGRVCWGKINGVQPAGTVDGSVENALHNTYLNKADSRIYIGYDTVTPSFRPRGILLEFLYFNYAVNESDENQIHDYLRRKYKHY